MTRRAVALSLALAACQSAPSGKPAEKPNQAAADASQPAKSNDGATPNAKWRATPPQPGPTPKLQLPVFQRAKLPNGLTVLVSNNPALPIVAFSVVTRAGSANDPKDKDGLTSLGYKLIGEGAGKRDALAFSDAVADLGASFSSGCDRDAGSITISGLKRNTDAMMGLLADAAIRPQLTKADFARLQKKRVANIIRSRGTPDGLAFEALPPLLYGPKHPYGHSTMGTPETVKAMSHVDVRRHLARVLIPSTSALVAVGDITLDEAVAIAKKHLGKWKGKRRPPPRHPAVKAKARKRITIVHKPNSPQTLVLLARPLFGVGNPDEVPLRVTNHIYGGAFSSRLNMKLREEKGYTYGARSSLTVRYGVGAFVAMSKIRQDVTAEGLVEFVRVLESMKASPPGKPEVQLAKDGLVKSLPGAFETNGAAAGAASTLFVYELPLDRYARRPDEINAVGLKDVATMAERYLDPNQMIVLLVGDADVIRDSLLELGLGEVVVRNR